MKLAVLSRNLNGRCFSCFFWGRGGSTLEKFYRNLRWWVNLYSPMQRTPKFLRQATKSSEILPSTIHRLKRRRWKLSYFCKLELQNPSVSYCLQSVHSVNRQSQTLHCQAESQTVSDEIRQNSQKLASDCI